jgi:hypothetical protein
MVPIVITIALLAVCGQHPQPTRQIPIEDFFRNPETTDFNLSPDERSRPGHHPLFLGKQPQCHVPAGQ